MRLICAKLSLLVIFIAYTIQTNGQTCNGSLGDPVINQDFGSGTNPGAPLGTLFTNYIYVINSCPQDGFYTIASSVPDTCFGHTWHTLPGDHTGNKNGYMMVVNASNQPGIFYEQQTVAGLLCPNTTYEFGAWICNLNFPNICGGNLILPNITFSIETPDGKPLITPYNTGDIAASDTVRWTQYRAFFTTPANATAVVVKMTNNAPGGCGNDLVLDDITFRACGPVIQTGFGSTTGAKDKELCQGSNALYTIKAQVLGNNNLSYQWQLNKNKTGWVDVAPPSGQIRDSLHVGFLNAIPGTYQYRLGVSNGSDISSVNCRVYSPPLTINVNPLPVVPAIAPQTVCEGYPLKLEATGGATYIWTGPSLPPTSKNPVIINNVTPANEGTYTVQVFSGSGCAAPQYRP